MIGKLETKGKNSDKGKSLYIYDIWGKKLYIIIIIPFIITRKE